MQIIQRIIGPLFLFVFLLAVTVTCGEFDRSLLTKSLCGFLGYKFIGV